MQSKIYEQCDDVEAQSNGKPGVTSDCTDSDSDFGPERIINQEQEVDSDNEEVVVPRDRQMKHACAECQKEFANKSRLTRTVMRFTHPLVLWK